MQNSKCIMQNFIQVFKGEKANIYIVFLRFAVGAVLDTHRGRNGKNSAERTN